MAAANGEVANDDTAPQDDFTQRGPPGTILPPKSMRDMIEKVAAYIARNGKTFEDKVRAGGAAKTAYLEPEDAYHAYYKWRVDEIKSGRGLDANAQNIARKTDPNFAGKETLKPPPEWQFSARMPNISAQDMEIVKLTALYAAKNGRSWVTGLAQREGHNYQFDFLRPQHSLNNFFMRMVDQYKDLLEGETADHGAPQKKRVAGLQEHVTNRFHVLESAKKRAHYQQHLEKQKVEKEEKAEKERIAFAQIDWHDFSVVQTVTFDAADEQVDLPPPKTLNDMLSLSLEEKANMRIDPNRRLEESVPGFDDYENFYGQQQQFPAAQMPQGYNPQAPASASASPSQGTPYAPPPSEVPTVQAERERIRAAAAANKQQARVRTDYVPQAQLRNQMQNTSICPICKQPIPNNEMEQHMKIEALSPEWREQMAKNQHRSSTTNLNTADVANNLKRLASQRADVFDQVTGQALSPEEQERRKRAELGAYDGISQAPNPAALGAMGQPPPGAFPPGAQPTDVQQQIRQLHERYKR
ncbi:Pre-mRNA-splicing factor [Fulvia fulva]|uniref:Pre-mRNA-splicing factor n=1 Tax=Passalora fulva TaxID=5499 RepID=A0A9Q8PLZ7_PASFU|nr:Pre-mRNA-splicing factor [Fulvia fulva]KAK4609182.1 Pre-mRNA-splicing factor [Fulvia fulva]KAK4609702.1 Pre-mRNA-splicing factor [Fulvia fulva]UJO24886.1 Pre-mRNA-splicing factor [Fulvia fulva]WPV22729.1 Pre-mRNA-splicing factor [Fulvia fulva]WPV37833.1 Pre-mRNA-splicing factor [Fulvia fulva]